MSRLLRLSLLLVLIGCVQTGGGQDGGACLGIACGPAYQIGFSRAAWSAGGYRIEVTADGVGTSCDIVIPMTCDHPPRCQGNPTWLPIAEGCALDPSQQRIRGIAFDQATPASVAVSVSQGGRALGMGTFMPGYSTRSLGCDLSCKQAPDETLSLVQ